MSDIHDFVPLVLGRAEEDPAGALVELWCRLDDHRVLEEDLSSPFLAVQATSAFGRLEAGSAPSPVHPLAALRAVGEWLWSGQRSPLSFEREYEGRRYHVCPRDSNRFTVLGSQPGHREYWSTRYQVIPTVHRGIQVGLRGLPFRTYRRLAADPLTYLCGGFEDGIHNDWCEKPPYSCTALLDPEVRWASVRSLLERAVAEETTLVVFPELTIDSEVRKRVRRWLSYRNRGRIALVCAGSFHQGVNPRFNIAYLLDGWGEVLLEQKKLRPMRTESEPEDIVAGDRVELFQAPFGLICMGICLDFFDAGNAAVAGLWKRLGPALVLVPSMGRSSTNSGHRRRAEELHRHHGTLTLVASQRPPEEEPKPPQALGLVTRSPAESGRDAMIEDAPVLGGALRWE